VIRPDPDDEEGISVVGGFAADSLEGPLEDEQVPPQVRRGDDELALAVTRALRADSYTTDLNIEVEVEDGVVYLRGVVSSLEDIEQAEEVAGRVPGVEDVEEVLEIVEYNKPTGVAGGGRRPRPPPPPPPPELKIFF
jgi:hypothetical protein